MKLNDLGYDTSTFETILDSGVSHIKDQSPEAILRRLFARINRVNLSEIALERHRVHYKHKEKAFNIYYDDGRRNQVLIFSDYDGQVYLWPDESEPFEWSKQGKKSSFKTKEEMLYEIGKQNGKAAYEHFLSVLNILDEPKQFEFNN